MKMENPMIDAGKAFDWGRTSEDYARYRDIYPELFYEKIVRRGLCTAGQKVLDLGTGTGVFPRNMYRFGAEWCATDICKEQIEHARRLSEASGMRICYQTAAAEDIDFPDGTFDVVTACQCFWYFDLEKLLPKLLRVLKRDGRLLLLYMAWLPCEDKIAGASEALVLKYAPQWTGAGETIHPISVPECVYGQFEAVCHEEYPLELPFTREAWHGRMKACRGVGASLSRDELQNWEREHMALLERIAPEEFCVRHYAAMLELRRKDAPHEEITN